MPKAKEEPQAYDEHPWARFWSNRLNDTFKESLGTINALLKEPPDEALLEWCRAQEGVTDAFRAYREGGGSRMLTVLARWPKHDDTTHAETFITALEKRLGYTLERAGPPSSGGLMDGPVI